LQGARLVHVAPNPGVQGRSGFESGPAPRRPSKTALGPPKRGFWCPLDGGKHLSFYHRRALIALLLVSAVAACANLSCARAHPGSGSLGSGSLARTSADAARELLAQFIEALNTCDLEKTMALFSEDATAFFPFAEHAERVEGKKDISRAFAEFYEGVRSQKQGPRYMNIAPQRVVAQAEDDVAVVSFQIVSGPVTSRRTLVLKRRNGKWAIFHLHASNIRAELPG
jgi:uncharacterized protein (TIGR02246 family)